MANKTALELLGRRKFRWYNNLGLLSESMQEGDMTFRSLEDLEHVLKERYAFRYASATTYDGTQWTRVYINILKLPESAFIDFVLNNRLTNKENLT